MQISELGVVFFSAIHLSSSTQHSSSIPSLQSIPKPVHDAFAVTKGHISLQPPHLYQPAQRATRQKVPNRNKRSMDMAPNYSVSDPTTTNTTTTTANSEPNHSPSASSSPQTRFRRPPNLSNPLPLSSPQEASVRDLYHARVRAQCAEEIAAFAACATNRTVTATWVCRAQRLAMNGCMITHATREEEDRAREEWFRTREESVRRREEEERKVQERRREVIELMRRQEEKEREENGRRSSSWWG